MTVPEKQKGTCELRNSQVLSHTGN